MFLLPANPAANGADADNSQICTAEHCFHAFDSLFCHLTSNTPIEPRFPDEKYPLFVTWSVRHSKPGKVPRLRGCIGCFEPLPLHKGISEYALKAAIDDYRFNKIKKAEFETLFCGVSLLTDFEDASSYLDWTIGVHGIHIQFPHPMLDKLHSTSSTESTFDPSPSASSAFDLSRPMTVVQESFSSTYLPDVIPEQGWDKIEAIDSAIHKAGYTARITDDLRRSIKLRRYQSRKAQVSWEEFIQWRESRGGRTAYA